MVCFEWNLFRSLIRKSVVLLRVTSDNSTTHIITCVLERRVADCRDPCRDRTDRETERSKVQKGRMKSKSQQNVQNQRQGERVAAARITHDARRLRRSMLVGSSLAGWLEDQGSTTLERR